MDYKAIATALWDLLDNIDTASDMFKPCENNGINSYENFYKYAMKKSSERHKLLKSDGYKLYSNKEFDKLPKHEKQTPSEQLNLPDVVKSFYCASELYEDKKCKSQCDSCIALKKLHEQ